MQIPSVKLKRNRTRHLDYSSCHTFDHSGIRHVKLGKKHITNRQEQKHNISVVKPVAEHRKQRH